VIDAGHGGKDPGTHNIKENPPESEINLKIALALAARLKARGDMQVTLTRKDDRTIDPNPRFRISNVTKPDVFVSIHANGGGVTPGAGFMSIWSQRQPEPAADRSPWLASWVGAALLDAGFRPTRPGVDLEDPLPAGKVAYRSSWDTYGGFATDAKGIAVLDYNHAPAVLVETHHRDNRAEVEAFQKPETIARFVEGLELGLLNFLHAPDGPKEIPETAPADGFWTVQVLATTARADAERVADSLRAAKIEDVQVREHTDPEQQTHYRVRVGKIAARSGVKALQAQLQKAGHAETWAVFEKAPAEALAPAGAGAPAAAR
jgi:N-acetylmuramoyl-L-alanine amidase